MNSRKFQREEVRLVAEVAARLASEQTAQQVSPGGAPPRPAIRLSVLTPGAARQVYSFNDPRNFATAQDPRLRPFSRVSVETLRTLARNYDILAACITHLKSEVVKVPVKVVAKCAHDDSAATKQQVQRAKAFLSVTGGMGGCGCHREEYEALLLDDLLVVGAGCSFLEYSTVGVRRDGNPDAVTAIDASTIRPLVTAYGFAPGPLEDCYEQWVQGIRVAGFKRDELIYRGLPIFARTDSPYWLSPVELLISVVYTALKADEWNRTWLTDGNTPDWWMKMPDTMSPDQIIEWLDLFDTMLAGNAAQRHKVKVTPGEPRTGNARKEADFAQFETWLMQRACSVMGVNPASIGHHSDTYKDSQEIALKSTSGGRVAQLRAFRRSHYNELLERKGLLDVEVQDEVFDAEDAKARAERHQIELSTGQRTLNETRKEDGLEPYEHPLADVPLVGSSLVVLDSLQGATAPPDDPVGRALRRFEKKALNRLRENGNAKCEFAHDSLPPKLITDISRQLEGSKSRAEIKALFEQASEELARFDPNQPRDERGRWTSGGKTGGHSLQPAESGREKHSSWVGEPVVVGTDRDWEATRFPSEYVSTESQRKTCANNHALYTDDLKPAGGELASHYKEAERVRGELQNLARQKKEIESRHMERLEHFKRREKEIRMQLESLDEPKTKSTDHSDTSGLRQSLLRELATLAKKKRRAPSQYDYENMPVERRARELLLQQRNSTHDRIRVTHVARWNHLEFERYSEAMRELEDLVAASVRPGLEIRMQRSLEKKQRSKWNETKKTMYLRRGAPFKIAVHEGIHALERNNEDLFQAALAFHRRRTLGEEATRLRDLVPGDYRDDEMVKRDRYPREYMGKEYPPEEGKIVHGEVLSVGVEMMVSNPAAFAREDPESFDFIFSALRNPAAARAHQEELLRRAEAEAATS